MANFPKANSKSELKDLILYHLKKSEYPEDSISSNDLDVINYWTSNTDGNASSKLREKTIEILNYEKN